MFGSRMSIVLPMMVVSKLALCTGTYQLEVLINMYIQVAAHFSDSSTMSLLIHTFFNFHLKKKDILIRHNNIYLVQELCLRHSVGCFLLLKK